MRNLENFGMIRMIRMNGWGYLRNLRLPHETFLFFCFIGVICGWDWRIDELEFYDQNNVQGKVSL